MAAPVRLLLGALLLAAPMLPGAASAVASGTAPGSAPGLVTVGPVPGNTPATSPVQDLTFPVEDLVFPDASLDGAVTDSGGRDFTLRSDVLFAFDKADLTARARREITRIAGLLAQPAASAASAGPVTAVRVTGYTDAKGSDDYNQKLSQRRAQAVQGALTAALGGQGITVTAVGRGEHDPVATNKNAAGQALNRRVEIRAT